MGSQAETIAAALLSKYGKVIDLATKGATAGEKTAASSAAKKMEAKYPGIAAQFAALAADATPAGQAAAHVKPVRDAVDALPEETIFQKMMKQAADWSVDKLDEIITNGINNGFTPDFESVEQFVAKSKKKAASDPMISEIDWDDTELVESLEDYAEVEVEAYEDVDDPDAIIIEANISLPEGLVEYIKSDPDLALAFVEWFFETGDEE